MLFFIGSTDCNCKKGMIHILILCYTFRVEFLSLLASVDSNRQRQNIITKYHRVPMQRLTIRVKIIRAKD